MNSTPSQVQFADAYIESPWPRNLNLNSEILNDSLCQLKLLYSEEVNNGTGSIHGGIIASSMHDAGLLLATHLFQDKPEINVNTIDFQISYLCAAKGTDLTVSAKLLRKTSRLAFIQIVSSNQNGDAIASVNACFGGGDKVQSNQFAQDLHLPLLSRSVKDHPFKKMMQPVIETKIAGMSIQEMGEGFCRMKLENIERYQDQEGNIALGAQLMLVDNVGAFASLSAIDTFGIGSTIDLKLTQCDTAIKENVIAVAESMVQRGSQMSSRFMIIGERSEQLKAYGAVTIWVKF